MHALLKKLHELCPKDNQILSALRHCAAMLVGGKTLMHYLCKYKAAGGAPKRDSITIADECSEIQLHMWMELAQWKQMGVRFIILGDFKGQLKPIYDRWQDAMDEKDIAKSQFLHEMCGGLEVQLTKYRRGADALLFKRYTNLYQWADCKDRASVDMAVNEMASFYPYAVNHRIDHHFVMSHKKRMLFNHASNYKLAGQQAKVLFLAGPKDARETPGVCMQA